MKTGGPLSRILPQIWWLKSALLRRRFHIELQDHTFANKVIRLARVLHSEIKAVDREFRAHIRRIILYFDLRRKSDLLGHAVQRQVPCHGGIRSLPRNRGRLEDRGWILLHF